MTVPTTKKTDEINNDFSLDTTFDLVAPTPIDPVAEEIIEKYETPKKYIANPDPYIPDDPVNHPSHYIQGGIETIDVIEAWELDYCLGNTVKYISRAGKKDPEKIIQDLEKARWYLDREISNLKRKQANI